jgi:ribosomal protein S18 acetylase RimI-like enzyme
MSVLFCQRQRMEIDLSHRVLDEPQLPHGYQWQAWSLDSLERHATVKFHSFHDEQDGRVFRSLREQSGCRSLMEYISGHEQFLPEVTWLLVYSANGCIVDCGTVQGIAPAPEFGAIQNVGILPTHRHQGLGRALMLKALREFQKLGIFRVSLEVTSANQAAVRLYESLGFRLVKTLFRKVDL